MAIRAKKRFGQNFLRDKNILGKIVQNARVDKNDHVIEVGPGLGTLTEFLADSAKQVTAIEIDRDLIEQLEEKFVNKKNVKILHGDVLKFTPPISDYKVVANIPYYITSPILNHFLQASHKPLTMTLLVQKEVADKITEKDGKTSVLSLQVKLFAHSKTVQKIPPHAFFPVPKVHSALIHLTIKTSQEEDYIDTDTAQKIMQLAKIAFSNKRKKLSNTLPKEIFKNSSIDPNRRPETLSVEEWKELTESGISLLSS